MAFLSLEPLIPIPAPTSPLPVSPLAQFALGTLAGLPVVAYVALAVSSVVRRRWRTLAVLAVAAILASLAIAAIWLLFDVRVMPTIEHYSFAGWYLALLPGVSLVSILTLAGRALDRTHRALLWRASTIAALLPAESRSPTASVTMADEPDRDIQASGSADDFSQ
jgi:hypothetical protein